MIKVVPLEIEASSKLGYNLGIKLIRGAYMNEERHLAAKGSYESPIHNTLEDTHLCYNTNLKLLTSSMKPSDRLFIGSHNLDSIEIARSQIHALGLN